MVNLLQEPFALAVVGGIISLIVLYVNNKIKNKKNEKNDYLKTFGLVSIICFIVLQIFSYNITNMDDSDVSGGGTTIPASLLNDRSTGLDSGGINMRSGHPEF